MAPARKARLRKTKRNAGKEEEEQQKQEHKRHRSMGGEHESRTKKDAHPQTAEQEEETNSERDRKTVRKADYAYQLVGSRAIILGTCLQDPTEEDGGEQKQHRITRISRHEAEQENYIIQDDVEYADDAQLFMEKDTHEQMCARLGNYSISSETRELNIQRINVLLLVHAGREPKEATPPPFDQIKFSQGGVYWEKRYT